METESISALKVIKLIRQQEALAEFGTFAFQSVDLQLVLDEAARLCAFCLDADFATICEYRPLHNDLIVVAGFGWNEGVVGFAVSSANETSPQGRAFITGLPQTSSNIEVTNTYAPPAFYAEHGVLSTADVIVASKSGSPFGILEVDSQTAGEFDQRDIAFLTGFANVLAEAVATRTRSDALLVTNRRMAALVEEKEILSEELKHRVRNSLHLVYGLLTAEMGSVQDKKGHAILTSIALRVMGLAQVFDHLLGVGMTREIRFDDYLRALCTNLPDLFGELSSVKLTCSVQPLVVELDRATALGIIVTELVANAYSHASFINAGKISVSLSSQLGQASLQVHDNGQGFTMPVETKRHGLGLVRRLVKQVGATLECQSGAHGTTWAVTFAAD
jgi:two-component sensor histidine kinase